MNTILREKSSKFLSLLRYLYDEMQIKSITPHYFKKFNLPYDQKTVDLVQKALLDLQLMNKRRLWNWISYYPNERVAERIINRVQEILIEEQNVKPILTGKCETSCTG
jgi:hypothetical protein